MTSRGKTHHKRQKALAIALAGLLTATTHSALAIDAPSRLTPSRAVFTPTPPGFGGDALAVGGMLAHLDNFVEMGDGTVRADISFHNTGGTAASFVAPTMTRGDQIGGLLQALQQTAELVNSEGRKYRLVALSQFGDTQTRSDWISVPPGGSAVVTATFAAEGAQRGAQPFALSLPIRETWQASADGSERSSVFAVNFRGLHRPTDEAHAAPAPHVEKVALPLTPTPARAPEVPASANYTDDLAPAIAKLATARPDSRRYLIAIGVSTYDEAPAVPFADRSAREMTDLLHKLYGIPVDNIMLITGADATGTRISGRINSMLQRLTPGDTLFFYYAGHGLSARDGSGVYIVPKDAVPGAYEADALSLGGLLSRFEASPATRVVAFLDTCFSGRVSRDQSLFPGTAPLVPVPVEAGAPPSNSKVTVFLAGQANQFANDYPERGHRLFSYYIMQGLLAGYTSATDLKTFVAREVRRISAKRGSDFVQEPHLEGAAEPLPAPSVRPRATAQRD